MNTIFRAWDTKENAMILDFTNHAGLIAVIDKENAWNQDRYIREMYTGLTDHNGKRIFEGDIYHTIIYPDICYEVRFINGAFCGGLLGADDNAFAPLGWMSELDSEDMIMDNWNERLAIIGNIHENQELVNVK